MNKFMQLTKDFINDEEGLTIVEYVLGAAALVIAVGGFFTAFFDNSTGLQKILNDQLSNIGS